MEISLFIVEILVSLKSTKDKKTTKRDNTKTRAALKLFDRIAVKSDRIVTFHKIKTGIKNLKDIRAVDIGIPLKVDKLILEGEDFIEISKK